MLAKRLVSTPPRAHFATRRRDDYMPRLPYQSLLPVSSGRDEKYITAYFYFTISRFLIYPSMSFLLFTMTQVRAGRYGCRAYASASRLIFAHKIDADFSPKKLHFVSTMPVARADTFDYFDIRHLCQPRRAVMAAAADIDGIAVMMQRRLIMSMQDKMLCRQPPKFIERDIITGARQVRAFAFALPCARKARSSCKMAR